MKNTGAAKNVVIFRTSLSAIFGYRVFHRMTGLTVVGRLYVMLVVAIHKTVSAVLLLGNLQFKQERNSDQATMPDDTG
jgi:hypothetical protein